MTTPSTIIGSSVNANTLCLSIGINEITTKSSFSIFPNPTESYFTLQLNSEFTNAQLQIFNTFGALVYEQIITETATFINLPAKAGIYFVKVGGKDKTAVRKLIIQ